MKDARSRGRSHSAESVGGIFRKQSSLSLFRAGEHRAQGKRSDKFGPGADGVGPRAASLSVGAGRMTDANTDKVGNQAPAAVLREVATGVPVFLWCFVDLVLILSPEISVCAPSCRRNLGGSRVQLKP